MAFVDKSRVEPTIFFIEEISFSLKLFSGHFYGQSFIKTVRGPLLVNSRCSRELSQSDSLEYPQHRFCSRNTRAFSSNFGKRPLAKLGKNDQLNIKIGRN